MSKTIFEVSIPKYSTDKSYTEYQISIITNIFSHDHSCFTIKKRYSDFLNLHNALMTEIFYLPEFPQKVFFNKNKHILNERRNKLEMYIKYVCAYVIRNNFMDYTCGKLLKEFIQQ